MGMALHALACKVAHRCWLVTRSGPGVVACPERPGSVSQTRQDRVNCRHVRACGGARAVDACDNLFHCAQSARSADAQWSASRDLDRLLPVPHAVRLSTWVT